MTAAKKAKNPHEAERALAMLERSGVSPCEDDVLFNTVLDACIHRKDKVRLASVINAYEASTTKPSVHTYGLLIKAYGLLRRTANFRDLWNQMESRDIHPNE